MNKICPDPTTPPLVKFHTFFQLQKQIYIQKCLFVRMSAKPLNSLSCFILTHSSFFILPSSFFIHPSFISRLLSFSACFFIKVLYLPSTGCPTKNYTLFWRAVAPLNFVLWIKVGGVLESSGSQLFKTVPTFDFWPSKSWDIWGWRH